MEELPYEYIGEAGVNPELLIEDIPADTRSLAILMEDYDTSDKGTHWVVWDIISGGTHIKVNGPGPIGDTEYDVPNFESTSDLKIQANTRLGICGENDFGKACYAGPIPKKGTGIHHYFFKVYALDDTLNLRRGATSEELELAMRGHVIGSAQIIGVYER